MAPSLKPAMPDSPKSSTDWAGIGWLYLFFWFFSGPIQIILLPTTGTTGFRDVFFLSFIWLAPVFLFPRWTRQASAVIGIILWGSSVISLGYFIIYRQEFSRSVIFTLFESNFKETSEYLTQYVSFPLIAGTAVFTLVALLLWRRLRPVHLPRSRAFVLSAFFVLANIAYPYAGYPYAKFSGENFSFKNATEKLQRRMEPAAPWQLITGYIQYRGIINTIKDILEKNSSLPPLENLVDINGDTPRTLILVIGESTTSRRMSLYGYPRKTTPHLDALKERGELIVFNDVITSRPFTIEALQQALSFADQEEPRRFLTEPNLMNLMKQAGYKSFWITNQQTMSHRNTLLTMFSLQADKAVHMNQQRRQNTRQYDEIVFEPFADALKDSAPKKFIVLHLLGTHSNYAYRYPEKYERFTRRTHVPPVLTDRQTEIYNSYDNAILYNDFVVSSLIESFRQTRERGFLLYFSDHGEEVFDEPPHQVLGRNEDAPTRNMYAIPFMLWMPPGWKRIPDTGAVCARKYSNAHFIHTWSDMAGLSYDRFRPELSLVNPDFKPRTRWIGNPETGLRDFDALPP
ncbi:MAG: phosphoethanolamine transferase CptA [Candidatus Accumulibacter sp.]|jgi:heptose-I-phosphate ethanolaminephosphotransferase|nr:phosphoethanolamine transferase CptA [Accumulibacter sp.]